MVHHKLSCLISNDVFINNFVSAIFACAPFTVKCCLHNDPIDTHLILQIKDEVFDSFSGGNGRNSVVVMSGGVYESGRAAGGSMAALLESLQVCQSGLFLLEKTRSHLIYF